MDKAPDRIWFTPWDEGEENGTAGPASHTGGKPPNGDATEYILNTPDAMRNAGYVPIEQLATARNDALEEAAWRVYGMWDPTRDEVDDAIRAMKETGK